MTLIYETALFSVMLLDGSWDRTSNGASAGDNYVIKNKVRSTLEYFCASELQALSTADMWQEYMEARDVEELTLEDILPTESRSLQ